jgi:hypothetical protein
MGHRTEHLKELLLRMQDDFNPPLGVFSQKFEETCTYYMLFAFITNANLAITIQINHQPDATIFQFIILLFIYLFIAQHVLGVFPPIIRSSMTAVEVSGFTFASW